MKSRDATYLWRGTAAAYGCCGRGTCLPCGFLRERRAGRRSGPGQDREIRRDGARAGDLYARVKCGKNNPNETAHALQLRRDSPAATEFGTPVRLQSTCAGLLPLRRCNNALFDSSAKFSTPARAGRAFGSIAAENVPREKRFQRRASANGSSNARCATRIWVMSSQTDPSDRLALLHELGGAALCPPKKS